MDLIATIITGGFIGFIMNTFGFWPVFMWSCIVILLNLIVLTEIIICLSMKTMKRTILLGVFFNLVKIVFVYIVIRLKYWSWFI